MAIPSYLKKSVYSALVFFGTLIVLSVAYAAYQTINSSEYTSGQPLTQSLFGKVVNNIADHETRIASLTTSAVPSGAIMAFSLATCPTGWTEYTAARGRFLRGLDNGSWNDPNCATRTGWCVVGSTQNDDFKSHGHNALYEVGNIPWSTYQNWSNWTMNYMKNTIPTSDTWWSETRPKNVMVLFCSKN